MTFIAQHHPNRQQLDFGETLSLRAGELKRDLFSHFRSLLETYPMPTLR
jgi:hypothetical protein